ncbi:MAG TPA: M20 family peptidase [Bacteroidales bacterium]|jgi:carboxypeptidase PM20D1|nr:MAG: Succinyl-diaminopimelate desuccinylase [Bacteroidetes bacterium ADurb.Bin145]HQG63092.1 M20 family peptidase [Bacteroidales bacterium]
MKKLVWLLSAIIGLLLIVIIIKTIAFKSMQTDPGNISLPVFGDESADRLSRAISFPTISYEPGAPIDTAAFGGYHKFLSEAYPLLHSKLKKEIFSSFSLLYTWEGRNKSLKPVILMAHMDVVPAGETGSWTKPPFSGENDGTYIWGRGTLDDKAAMISILEAVEKLLSENYQPERTVYLAFGHDEEISGLKGAAVIAAALKERGVEAEFVIDEGYAVTIGMVPLIDKPVALIGTSEKGYLSVSMTVEMEGGHSAYPAAESAIIVLNRALKNIVDNPMKAKISRPVDDFIRYIGPEMPFYARAIFANKWLFKGVILKIYAGGSNSNALVRTTTAPTIFNAGFKDNVVPTKAEAVVNFRILPGETSNDVIEHLKKVIADNRVVIKELEGRKEPAPDSPINVPGFDVIHKTIRQVYPEALVAPTMMIAASDSRKYTGVSSNIYNFAPIMVTSEDLARTHGLNERNKIEDYKRGIGFFYQLIKNCDN